MIVEAADLIPICLPLRHPIRNSQHSLSHRTGTLIRLITETGIEGWGEATPYPGFRLESSAEARSALGRIAKTILGSQIEDRDGLLTLIHHLPRQFPSAGAAIETALLDLFAKTTQCPLHETLIPTATFIPKTISCNALILRSNLRGLESSALAQIKAGYQTFKLKVGEGSLDHDLERVARLRECVGPEAKIRLDANQSYDLATALYPIEKFARYGIEYLEQPLRANMLREMAELRMKSPIPLAADESAIRKEDVQQLIDLGAADVIIIKPSAAGGPLSACDIARLARRSGLRVVITSLIDSAVGVSAALQAAFAISKEGELPACGLATSTLLSKDVASQTSMTGDALHLGHGLGLGIELNLSSMRDCISGPITRVAK